MVKNYKVTLWSQEGWSLDDGGVSSIKVEHYSDMDLNDLIKNLKYRLRDYNNGTASVEVHDYAGLLVYSYTS